MENAASANSDLDELLEILSHSRRRHVIDILAEHESLSLTDLAAALAKREEATSTDTPREAVTDRLAVSLHHCHLPKLDDADIVEYEPEDGEITLFDAPSVDDLPSPLGQRA